MERSERRGKRESKERQTERRIGEKLLPAAQKVSASLLSIRTPRKTPSFIILIIAFNRLSPFLIVKMFLLVNISFDIHSKCVFLRLSCSLMYY